MFVLLLRTVIMYVLIVFGLRIMGKRQLGELQPSEFVITILISNIATLPIEDTNVPLLGGVIPILTLVCFEVFISSLTLKNKAARKLISGSPRMLIRDGIIDQHELKNIRFSIDDLMEELRGNNIFDIRDVGFAIVETTGKVSVYQKFNSRNVTPAIMKIENPISEDSPPVIIISDKEVIEDGLNFCNLKHDWLNKTLKENGYTVHDIFLMTCNRKADYYIVPLEKQK